MSDTLELTEDVREALAAARCDGELLVLAGQLDRKAYQRVAKALELMGGTWSRKRRAHVFADGDAAGAVADALATGTVLDARKHFQFFETPVSVAASMLSRAEIRPDMRVLEPSAGRGAIVQQLLHEVDQVDACELWDRNIEELTTYRQVRLVARDFLKFDPKELYGTTQAYDRIVANPPFSRGQDVEHVRRMLAMLAPEGMLVSVMSPGWTFREDRRHIEFRDCLRELDEGGLADVDWRPLPEGSFRVSGTMVRAGILAVRRKS